MSKSNKSYRVLVANKFRFPSEVIFIGRLKERYDLDEMLQNAKDKYGANAIFGMTYGDTHYVRYENSWMQFSEYQEKKRIAAIPAWRRKYEGAKVKSDAYARYYADEKESERRERRDGVRHMRKMHDMQARNSRYVR